MFGRRTGKTRARASGAALTTCLLVAVAAGCGGAGGSSASSGSGWQPNRGVTIVVPYAPGGGSDVFGRALGQGIEETRSDVNVKVVNKAGGSGTVGYSFFYSQRGDAHYLLPSETAAVVLPLTTEVPWTWSDFTPIMQIAEDAIMLVVPADSPYKSLQDINQAAKQGKKLRISTSGATGVDTIVTNLWEREAGVSFRKVAFGSGGEIVAALLGGAVEMGMLNLSEVIGQVKAGKLRPIAVFAEDRYERPPLGDVPTAKEQGVDVTFTQYRGVFAPPGLDDDEISYWVETVTAWTKTEGYKQGYIEANFLKPVQRKHEEFISYLKDYEQTVKSVLEQQ